MYGLQATQDLGFLKDRELMQVCFGQFQTVLKFDKSTEVILECEVQIQGSNKKFAPDCVELLGLLGQRISRVCISGEPTLCITFDSGIDLAIFDSNIQSESFQIRNEEFYVVV
jgi:hypothetical protein